MNCMKTEYMIITLLLCSLFAMPFSGCKAANESDVSEIQTSTASLTSEDTVLESFPSYGTVEETETDADKSYIRMLNDDVLHPESVVLSSLYVRSRRLNTWLSSLKTALTIDKV